MKLDYRALRNGEAKPRLHPNGFVQLDLGGRRRLHIWPEAPLVPGVRKEPIHDHTFSFDSEVLLGALTNVVYELAEDPNGELELFTVKPFLAAQKVSPLVRADEKRYRLDLLEEITITAGQNYHFDAFRFHDSKPHGLTASIMSYSELDPAQSARVLRVAGVPLAETFDRNQVDSEILWNQIETVCGLVNETEQ